MKTQLYGEVTLRGRYGSLAEVVRVYAFDAFDGSAVVKCRTSEGMEFVSCYDIAEDLEAFKNDEVRTLVPIVDVVRIMAEEILNDN